MYQFKLLIGCYDAGAKFLLSSIHENSDMLRELLGVEPQDFQPSIPN